MKVRSVVIKILGVTIPLSAGGGPRSTTDFQSVKETSLQQDRSLIKFSWEIQSGVTVWLGVPLLMLGRGLRSTEEFKSVMVTSIALDASVVKFS